MFGGTQMAVTLFKDTTYNLQGLIENIRRGEIALPEIQRPFVWQTAKVRELFDSMYRGFPVGYLLFWATGAEVGSRRPTNWDGREGGRGSPPHRRRAAATDVTFRRCDWHDDRAQGL